MADQVAEGNAEVKDLLRKWRCQQKPGPSNETSNKEEKRRRRRRKKRKR